MKGVSLLLDLGADGRGRAALMVDGRLLDLLIDPPATDSLLPGEIGWAKIGRKADQIGGAFVSLEKGGDGFLRESKGLRQGERVLVQGSSFAEPGKAAPVSRRVLHKGRRVILTPDAPGINVSRRIRAEEERQRLVTVVEEWGKLADGCGVILRSAAQGADKDALTQELDWVQAQGSRERPWALAQALAEWTDPLPDEIVCGQGAYEVLTAAGQNLFGDPDLGQKLRLSDAADPFEAFGVHEEIQRLAEAELPLPSGGFMAIEATRALVAVDVNTGAGFSAGAAMTANIEAARELPRQLRLRGLGGQVIVDFAPLKKMHRKKIEETLGSAFRRDRVETSLAGWTPLGNFELQRKRERCPIAACQPVL